jgi:MSHA biogenesis protein MshP
MRREAGMSLVMAIFLLLMLAGLGAFIASLSAVQQADSALDFLGSQAYHAARAGLDYGAYQAIKNPPCPAGAISLALPAANFGQFASVRLTYVASAGHDEGGTLKTLCTITANACNQPVAGICPNPAPGVNYVERELQLSVINPP